jgi:hypothetical protein
MVEDTANTSAGAGASSAGGTADAYDCAGTLGNGMTEGGGGVRLGSGTPGSVGLRWAT